MCSFVQTVFDAWGKIPSGILLGNQYELGNFDECLEVNYKENMSTFVGQYCLTQINVKLPEQTALQQTHIRADVLDLAYKKTNLSK